MAELCVVGVRHHSPACARVVAHIIATRRPTHVLIEGPSDFGPERMRELALDHTLPIAIYSYALGDTPRSRAVGVWSPLCEYSPEWVAIRHGLSAGALVRFIDLPAWDAAFRDVENRYADRELAQHHRQNTLGEALGFDSSDTLWDHLFEDPTRPVEVTARELETYFEALRGDDPTSERDTRREAFMARFIAWAMSESDGVVLVVCGGFHAPVLRRLWPTQETTPPTLPPYQGQTGSYLVPFSMHRLDSFTGYASGMPSPGFYQALWQDGPNACEFMLMSAVRRLRLRGQTVSTADVLAATELMHGLARLRGHDTPRRTDVLDALTAAFIKDALSQPPPWTERGVLPRGTDPILVEVVAAFSGDASGRLAATTPRPPLVDDVEARCEALGLLWDSRRLSFDALDLQTAPPREVLHRLRILAVPGVTLVQKTSLARGGDPTEVWRLERLPETDAVLIERAVYGADLASAARARLRETIAGSQAIVDLVACLRDALSAGYAEAFDELLPETHKAIDREPSLGALGVCLVALRVFDVSARDHLAAAALALDELFARALERAGWLLEGRDGAGAPLVREEVAAVSAMVSALRNIAGAHASRFTPLMEMTVAIFHRRVASPLAPPWLRGACLGGLWVLERGDEALASSTLMATPDVALGDLLNGLLSTAREPFGRSDLLTIVDLRLAALDDATFLGVLPSLRAAFAALPPFERLSLAKRLAKATDARALVAPLPAVDRAETAALEARAFALTTRYGLLS